MELSKILIKNFRSIKNETIVFNNNCLVLLGKNEAGKSNILKAIASVFGKYEVTEKDKRKKIDNEKIEESYVRAIIKLSKDDFKMIEERFNQNFTGTENIIFKSGISLLSYIEKIFYNLLIRIDISNGGKPYYSRFRYERNDIDLKQKLYLSGKSILLEGSAELDLEAEVFKIAKELYLENPINCHYWNYNEGLLLPNSIEIEEFKKNPSNYKALENIFHLCDRSDIKEEFEDAKSQDGDYINLFKQVSKKVTNTFQKIWPDFKGTSIELITDGSQVRIKIAEKAHYNCEDRSDGFKRFISILLMLSTQARANKLENDIILIDEPDQSLYPTSAQYLREELIEISKKSKVVYSTHSQYMIDSENLDRHIVVEKNDDITTLKTENKEAPYANDELLRRAVGASIFECIKSKNIVFEGYLDKKLFNKYCSFNKLESTFKDYGQVYLAGISGVESVVSILLSANKKFLIIADSDDASNSRRKAFQNNYPDHKSNWLAYADVCTSVSTMEDFMCKKYVKSQLSENGYQSYDYQDSRSVVVNIDKAVGGDKEKKQDLKGQLAQDLKKKDIEDSYKLFVDEIKEKLKKL